MKKNEDLTKELVDANETLAKFNKISTMLDEQIQLQRMKGETQGLGYTAFEKGEPSGTKDNIEEGKSTPKIQKSTSKKPYKPVCFNYHKSGHTANVFRYNIVDGFIDLMPIKVTNLEPLMDISTLSTCMDVDLLNASMEQII